MPNSAKFDFSDKVVVVTGAAGNLGIAVTQAYLKAGASMVLLDRSPDRLHKLFGDLAASANHYLAGGGCDRR